MSDISIDIETLGQGPNAKILSIGAVAFNADRLQTIDYMLDDAFYVNLDWTHYRGHEFDVDESTVKWWSEQSPEARAALEMYRVAPDAALQQFVVWVLQHLTANGNVWARPPSFDCVILENTLKAFKLPIPWNFRQPKCHRTLEYAYTQTGGRETVLLPSYLVKHRPDHDAAHQCWQIQRWQKALNDARGSSSHLSSPSGI